MQRKIQITNLAAQRQQRVCRRLLRALKSARVNDPEQQPCKSQFWCHRSSVSKELVDKDTPKQAANRSRGKSHGDILFQKRP